MTGHNFGDQLGQRGVPGPATLYDALVNLFNKNKSVNVQLLFAPPQLLKQIHPDGYKDLVEISFPRMWDLTQQLQPEVNEGRLRVGAHRGAMFMSAFVRDPDDDGRALFVTTPRWVTDASSDGRLFLSIWKKDRPELFNVLWTGMRSSIRLGFTGIRDVAEQLFHELGTQFERFVTHQAGEWHLQ